MVRREIAGDAFRCITRGYRGDDREDHARAARELAWRLDERGARVRRTPADAFAGVGVLRLDVERDEWRRTGSPQAARDVKAGFAESEKSNRHGSNPRTIEPRTTEAIARAGSIPSAHGLSTDRAG